MAGGGYNFGVDYPDGSYIRVMIARGDGEGRQGLHWNEDLEPTQEHEIRAFAMIEDARRAVLGLPLPSDLNTFLDQEIGT
jgi:hypothetical protein